MKFCYLDESGTGIEPFAVMVGIIADSYRMRMTKEDWNDLLVELSDQTGRNIQEIHTRDLYRGNNVWRPLEAEERFKVIDNIISWMTNRGHNIVYSTVHKNLFLEEFNDETFSSDIGTLWRFMGFHITLALQKNFNSTKKNKGNTLLIFDNEVREQKAFTELVLNPPDWSDTYYSKKRKQNKLDQIIDVPHYVDSKQVGLIQLADFCCYFMRLFLELSKDSESQKYEGELEQITSWFNRILELSISKSNIYPQIGRSEAAELFYKYGAETIRNYLTIRYN